MIGKGMAITIGRTNKNRGKGGERRKEIYMGGSQMKKGQKPKHITEHFLPQK
jgi:hypothetical protein